jgi:DNA-binding transcriptional ArsR family regulator
MRNAPSSSLEFIAWAREIAAHLELPPHARHTLLVVASYSDAAGRVFPSVATIRSRLGYGDSATYDSLKILRERGLMTEARRRVGTSAVRHLTGEGWQELSASRQPEVQTSGQPELPGLDLRPAGDSDLRPTGDRRATEKSQREAVADARPEREILHPKLDEVVSILGALPEPYRHFDIASIESAIRAHPDRDPVAAAHIVASKVHAGQTHTVHLNALLLGVLSRMPPASDQPRQQGPRPRARSTAAAGGGADLSRFGSVGW